MGKVSLVMNSPLPCGYDFSCRSHLQLPNESEQALLDGLNLRLLTALEDGQRWGQLVVERHYLKSARLSGQATALCGRISRPMVSFVGLERSGVAPQGPGGWLAQAPAQPRALSGKPLLSLLDRLPAVREPRSTHGRRHPWPTILGIVCLAKLAGVAGAQRDIAGFAKRLNQTQRRQLGCYRNPKTGLREVPSQSTFFRALKAVSYDSLEPLLVGWQDDLLGPTDPNELVVLDGKAARGAGGQGSSARSPCPVGACWASRWCEPRTSSNPMTGPKRPQKRWRLRLPRRSNRRPRRLRPPLGRRTACIR